MKTMLKITVLGVMIFLVIITIKVQGQALYITVNDQVPQTPYNTYTANWIIIDSQDPPNQYSCSPSSAWWYTNITWGGTTFTASLPQTNNKVYRLLVHVVRNSPSEDGYKYSDYFNSYDFPYTIFYMDVKVE